MIVIFTLSTFLLYFGNLKLNAIKATQFDQSIVKRSNQGYKKFNYNEASCFA